MYPHHISATTSIQSTPDSFYEEREIGPVNQIHVSGAVNVFFKPSEQARLVISGEFAEGVKSVKTRIVNDALLIERDPAEHVKTNSNTSESFHQHVFQLNGAHGCQIQVNSKVRVHITSGSGAAGVNIGGRPDQTELNGGRVIAAVSLPQAPAILHRGSAKVILAELQQERLELTMRGTGSIEAQGRATQLHASLQGAGVINNHALVTQQANLNLLGMGKIEAHVEKEVRSSIAGIGTITVHGNPAIRKDAITGSGRIIYK
jgi:hypothetical protein